nr:odorant binding protein [Semanotus bifasciatus]
MVRDILLRITSGSNSPFSFCRPTPLDSQSIWAPTCGLSRFADRSCNSSWSALVAGFA